MLKPLIQILLPQHLLFIRLHNELRLLLIFSPHRALAVLVPLILRPVNDLLLRGLAERVVSRVRAGVEHGHVGEGLFFEFIVCGREEEGFCGALGEIAEGAVAAGDFAGPRGVFLGAVDGVAERRVNVCETQRVRGGK